MKTVLEMIAASGIDGVDDEEFNATEIAEVDRLEVAGLVERQGCTGVRLSYREFAQRIVDAPPGIDNIIVILKGGT